MGKSPSDADDKSSDDEIDTDLAEPSPTVHDTYKALRTLRRFSDESQGCPTNVFQIVDRVESFIMAEVPNRLKQSKLDSFLPN